LGYDEFIETRKEEDDAIEEEEVKGAGNTGRIVFAASLLWQIFLASAA